MQIGDVVHRPLFCRVIAVIAPPVFQHCHLNLRWPGDSQRESGANRFAQTKNLFRNLSTIRKEGLREP